MREPWLLKPMTTPRPKVEAEADAGSVQNGCSSEVEAPKLMESCVSDSQRAGKPYREAWLLKPLLPASTPPQQLEAPQSVTEYQARLKQLEAAVQELQKSTIDEQLKHHVQEFQTPNFSATLEEAHDKTSKLHDKQRPVESFSPSMIDRSQALGHITSHLKGLEVSLVRLEHSKTNAFPPHHQLNDELLDSRPECDWSMTGSPDAAGGGN